MGEINQGMCAIMLIALTHRFMLERYVEKHQAQLVGGTEPEWLDSDFCVLGPNERLCRPPAAGGDEAKP